MNLLKTCCCSCGCSLRTGSFLAGSTSLTISTLVFIAMLGVKSDESHNDEQRLLLINSFPIKLYLVLLLAMNALVASILLIIGAAKAWKRCLIPYIVTIPLGTMLAVPAMIFAMIEFSQNEDGPGGLVFLFMILFLGGVALHIYLVLVVVSHYYELDENEYSFRILV